MKNIRNFFFITCLSAIFSIAHADDTAQQLTQLLNNIHSMQANFTESVVNKKGSVLSQSQGQMALQRPGKFRWQEIKPNAQLIVTDGKKLWIYDRDLEQVSIRSFQQEPGEAPALLLSHSDETIIQKFNIKTVSGRGGLQWFLLTPKDSNNMFTSIKLGFANQQIHQMELRDHLGNITEIEFSRIVVNLNLTPTLFSFKPPRNVDVLDETKR